MRPTMMTYISEEPACLARILRDYRQAGAVETFAASTRYGGILLLATGSSLNAALCARAISLSNASVCCLTLKSRTASPI